MCVIIPSKKKKSLLWKEVVPWFFWIYVCMYIYYSESHTRLPCICAYVVSMYVCLTKCRGWVLPDAFHRLIDRYAFDLLRKLCSLISMYFPSKHKKQHVEVWKFRTSRLIKIIIQKFYLYCKGRILFQSTWFIQYL